MVLKNSIWHIKMHWVVGTWLITSILGLGRGHNTLFEGYDRTLSGYHLCSVNESVLVTHVISYPTSRTQRRPCGGWLPWTMCDVTIYETSYRTEFSNTSKQVMKCCHGYEQVGSYCALSLNRSAEFTSKPGLCPSVTASLWDDANPSGSACRWDIDCPNRQKCCQNKNIFQCLEPLPPANRSWCFNATITVKTAYELVAMDKGLFNHTRLLHSVVTGALGTNGTSVYHLWSGAAGPFTTSTSLLLCSSVVLSLENVSIKLHQLGNIEEVTNVVVEDVDECADPQLKDCSNHSSCNNTVGLYVCICHHGYQDLSPVQQGTVCTAPTVTTQPSTTTSSPTTTSHPMGSTPYTDVTQSGDDSIPEITSLFAYDVTNSTFNVRWTTNTQTGVKFHLVLLQGTTELKYYTTYTTSLGWNITGLNPGVLYTVQVTPIASENMGDHVEVRVRTDGNTLSASARVTNVVYTESLSDPNSEEHKTFCKSVMDEILSSLTSALQRLIVSGEVGIHCTSLSKGSVIVNFTIVFQPNTSLNMESVSTDLMSSLLNSHNFTVDSIHIEDLNECLLGEADCSLWAYCNNTYGSYTCGCLHGYTDQNLSRPGRSCAASSLQSSTISSTSNTNHPTNSLITSSPSTTATAAHVPPAAATSVQTNTIPTKTSTTLKTNPPGITLTSTTQTTSLRSTATSLSTSTMLSRTSIISHSLPGSSGKIVVECHPGFILVMVRRDYLGSYNIPESSLFLGQPECGSSGGNLTHVQLVAAWDKCGSTLEHNSTHNTVNVTLYNNMSSLSTHNGYLTAVSAGLAVPIICTYPSRIIISTGYSPTGFDVIKDIVEGSGSFQVTVRLLNGTFPLPENYTLSPEEEVIVEVAVNTTIPQIKVIINKCWATPTSDSSLLDSFVFLETGCPTPNSHTTVIQNGNDTVSLLSVRVFALIEGNVVYLHCQIQICVEIQDNTCKPACVGRTYRSSNLIGATRATFGPLLRLNTTKAPVDQTSNILQTVGFVLLGVGVFLFSLAAVAGLVYHKRKIGAYNFSCKPQQENFTYHVFDT